MALAPLGRRLHVRLDQSTSCSVSLLVCYAGPPWFMERAGLSAMKNGLSLSTRQTKT